MEPTWERDWVRLYLADCREVLPCLPDKSVDCVVTDPPWMDYETGRYDASGWHNAVEYLSPDEYMPELYRVQRDGSAAIIWCRWDCFEDHKSGMLNAGFSVRNCIVWAKPNHTAGNLDGNAGNQHEMAVFAVKGNWKRHGKRETNLWLEDHLFSRSFRHHPTEKPLGLMRRSVKMICPPDQVVLDCFMGSGTTGKAAAKLGRSFIGIEREPKYFDIAVRRISEALDSEPLLKGMAV